MGDPPPCPVHPVGETPRMGTPSQLEALGAVPIATEQEAAQAASDFRAAHMPYSEDAA